MSDKKFGFRKPNFENSEREYEWRKEIMESFARSMDDAQKVSTSTMLKTFPRRP